MTTATTTTAHTHSSPLKRKADSETPQDFTPTTATASAIPKPPIAPNSPQPTAPKSSPPATTTKTLKPLHTYLHLNPLPNPPPSTPLDAPTLRLHLLSALSTYLGLHGSAIPIDILAIHCPSPLPEESSPEGPSPEATLSTEVNPTAEKSKKETNIYIRVPVQDGDAVVAALTSWVGRGNGVLGLRVRGRSEWLGGVGGGGGGEVDGRALFA